MENLITLFESKTMFYETVNIVSPNKHFDGYESCYVAFLSITIHYAWNILFME